MSMLFCFQARGMSLLKQIKRLTKHSWLKRTHFSSRGWELPKSDDLEEKFEQKQIKNDKQRKKAMRKTQIRKNEHIDICLKNDVRSAYSNGFEKYRFVYNALPEIDYDEIDCSINFLGKTLDFPLLISAMTGGTEMAKEINKRLAAIAQRHNIALCVGSQRAMVENKSLIETFDVRRIAPDVLLFANMGAVQLNYGYNEEQCRYLVDTIGADALVLHLNPLHEAVQPEGDRNFKGLLPKIENIVQQLNVPVIIKEVGSGISGEVAQRLRDAGVKIIDVAGSGGTSFAVVEGYRSNLKNPKLFGELGISTAECLVDVKKKTEDIFVIASGGITNGIEIAKAIALEADLVGIASVILQEATESEEALDEKISELINELKITMFSAGASKLSDLKDLIIK